MTEQMQRIVLASRPDGEPTDDNFRLETVDLPQPGEGEVLVKSHYMSLDPYMRGRMDDAKSYAAPVPIGGTMEAADIPAAWNEGMKGLLGITPPGDGDGCLQDIHWYDGAWGYFPTYTLGAIAAAQIFAAAKSADGTITTEIAKGDFKPLLAWLGDAIHAKGSVLPVPELLTQATGRPLDAGVFKTHLEDRYLA